MKPGLPLNIWGQSDDRPHHPKELRKLSLKKEKRTNQLNKVSDEAEDLA